MAERPAQRRMSPSDSILWKMERDPVLRSTVTAVALFDRSPDWGRLTSTVADATRRVPWLRQVMTPPAIALDSPRWTSDRDFDLDYHLRRVRLPGTGSLDDVLRLAALEAMTSFDPARPPWEFIVVEGVGAGAALVLKFHHAATDGIGAMQLALELVDHDRPAPGPPAQREAVRADPRTPPGVFDGSRRLARLPFDVATLVARAGRSPASSLRSALEAIGWGARLLAPAGAPLSPIMVGRSTRLRFAAFDLSLGELRASARETGATLNDVFVAGVAAGLGRYHEASGRPVDGLRMTLPVSVRRPGDLKAGNRFVPVRFALALSADPRQLVGTVSRTVRAWRAGPALSMTEPMASVLSSLPAPLVARVFGSLLRNVDFVATNVPGPRVPVSLAGATIVGLYAFAPPSGAAVNVSLVTNAGQCCIGVNMDAAAVENPDLMTASLLEGLNSVLDLALLGPSRPAQNGAFR